MEYHSFANEFIKIASPAKALYAREKADSEFAALADSAKPTAAPKAFAKGFAFGAGIPMFISANMHLVNREKHVADAAKAVRIKHVAEALKHLGAVPDKVSPTSVASALDSSVFAPGGGARAGLDPSLRHARFTLDTPLARDALDIRTVGGDEYLASSQRHNEYLKKLKELEGKSGAGRRARAAVYPYPARLSGPGELKALESLGADILKRTQGAPESVSKTYWRNFLGSMKRSAKAPMLVGAIAGGMAVGNSLAKRKAYLDLQRRSRSRK